MLKSRTGGSSPTSIFRMRCYPVNSGCSVNRRRCRAGDSSRTSKGGDFTRYHREWRLQPAGDGTQTRAEFDLLVEVKTLVPDWLVAVAMERELNTHFRLVRERALDRITKER
jgi:hypothetical protein